MLGTFVPSPYFLDNDDYVSQTSEAAGRRLLKMNGMKRGLILAMVLLAKDSKPSPRWAPHGLDSSNPLTNPTVV